MSEEKGKKNGKCNITACQSRTNVIYYNREMRAYYCPRCAKKINHWTPGLCVKEDSYGVDKPLGPQSDDPAERFFDPK